MKSLWRLFSWRHARRHRLRTLLGLFSITLGVALFVSMEVSQASTVGAVETTTRKLLGRAKLAVTRAGGVGVDRGALAVIERVPGAIATPVLRVTATFADLPREGSMLVLGVDLRREARFRDFTDRAGAAIDFVRLMLDARAIILTESFAKRNGLRIGSRLRLNTPRGLQTVRVAGLVADRGPASVLGGNLAIMKIASVQHLFAKAGQFDRIDVAATGDAPLVKPLRAALGPRYRVAPIKTKSSVLEIVLARLKALAAVSVIALLVGLFIIYLSVSIGVVERSKEIGTLRALGASRAQIVALLLAEAGALGAVGSALGIAVGYGLARWLTHVAVESMNILIHLVEVSEMVMPPAVVVAAFVAGTLTSLVAALVPALRATRISPLDALRPAIRGFKMAADHRPPFYAGAALMGVCALGVARFNPTLPRWSDAALTAGAFLGMGLVLPQITFWISLAVRRPLRFLFHLEGYLAAHNALQYPQRTALTVTALGGALAILVASASTVTSFHVSVKRWMDDILPFDLTVWPGSLTRAIYSGEAIPRELEGRVKEVPGVALTYALRAVFQEYGEKDVLLVGVDFDGWLATRRLRGNPYRGALERPAEMAAWRRGESLIASANFAALHGLEAGDTIELATRRGPRRFRLLETLEDYSYPLGTLYLDLHAYADLWEDPALSYIDVAVAAGHTTHEVRARIGHALEDQYRAFVYSAEDVKRFGLAALDQAFQLTYVQVLISMVIGFFGIVNTLLISVLRRTREIGLLRCVGMARRQVAGTVVIEALLIALVGGGCGMLWGLLAAAFPVAHHIIRLSGFTLPFVVPWATLLAALGLALVIGLLASLVPARRAARLNVLEAVGYE